MTKVDAPFNFVPLSDTVYFPDWVHQISQDIPFSDGVSGRIRLGITAKTPIFVRNGMGKSVQDNSFSHVAGCYFIPASSIKGEVRSLLEIMSFGKMTIDPKTSIGRQKNLGQCIRENPKLLPKDHRSLRQHDLAECIFGYTDSEGDNSLKGRVQFGSAFATHAIKSNEVKLVLGTPSIAYYPIYIEQSGTNGRTNRYNTYEKGDGTLSGWKRYYIRKDTWEKAAKSDKINTKLIPLNSGATFESEISFHNLRPIELGALLSALTFHGNAETYDHQLGQAKPYGYGRCSYAVTLHGDDLMSAEYYMGRFEQEMDKAIGECWRSCRQIKELFTLTGNPIEKTSHQYLKNNEFKQAKNSGAYLERFTKEVTPKQPDTLTERFREEERKTRKAQLDELLSKMEQLDLEE